MAVFGDPAPQFVFNQFRHVEGFDYDDKKNPVGKNLHAHHVYDNYTRFTWQSSLKCSIFTPFLRKILVKIISLRT